MYKFNDGGREAAGHKGKARDCGARALAIVLDISYDKACKLIDDEAENDRITERQPSRSQAWNGVWPDTLTRVLEPYGYKWVATMKVGSGCKVHLKAEELPKGRIIARVSRHFVAVLDGVINDNHNPARSGTRCVYGYWVKTP